MLDNLYKSWIDTNEFSFFEAKELLPYFLGKDDRPYALKLMLQLEKFSRKEVKQLENILKNTRTKTSLLVQLSYYKEDRPAELAESIAAFSNEVLIQVCLFYNSEVANMVFVKKCWEKKNTELRVKLLNNIHYFKPIPKKWYTWIVQTCFSTDAELFEFNKAHFIKNCDASILWNVAFQKSNIEVMKLLSDAGNINKADLQSLSRFLLMKIEKSILSNELIELATCFITKYDALESDTLLDTRIYLGEKLAHALEKTLILKESPAKEKFSRVFEELKNLQDRTKALKILFYANSEKEQFPEGIELHNDWPWPSLASLDKNFYLDVIKHKNCPFNALSLEFLLALEDAKLKEVLQNKEEDYLESLPLWFWLKEDEEKTVFLKILNALPVKLKNKAIVYLLQDNTNLVKLDRINILTNELLGRCEVSSLKKADKKTLALFQNITRRALGEDPLKWEMFNFLSKDFSGTYGELLQAATLLSNQTP